MDEAAAAVQEDGAGERLSNGDQACEINGISSTGPNGERVGVFCCQDCGEEFREEKTYLEHHHQHLQDPVGVEDRLEQLNNEEMDNEATNFCTLCSVSFVEASDFHSHMEKNHSQNSQSNPCSQTNSGITKRGHFECPVCGKCYGVLGHFLNHERKHKPPKSVFNDLEPLKKKSFQCQSCGRSYTRASALDAHRRCHEEKLVKSRNRGLEDVGHTEESVVEVKPSEIQIDSPEKLFECSCGKTFLTLGRLKTHQRFSGKGRCWPEGDIEKPKPRNHKFKCNECQKSYSSHVALQTHQRWHANQSNGPTKYQCEQCGKAFVSLSFYYRHQRLAHSSETPAKSFEHQVCQLQKKAFECQECGLKFSRSSALHSHQLHHTDMFKDTEKNSQLYTPLLPQPKILEVETKRTEKEQMESQTLPLTVMSEDNLHVKDTEEDLDSYEPGDLNVQVISASESEEESIRDMNPDLELLCESDQEVREGENALGSPSDAILKREMDLKIVQVDFELADVKSAPVAKEEEKKTTEERFDCPECYRWFTSASSLRVHRVWHGIHERRRQNQGQSVAVHTCDTCFHEASSYEAHCTHIQQHENENTSDVLFPTEALDRDNSAFGECGKGFSQLSALVSHQLHLPKRKQFQCSGCTTSYLHASSLLNHMKNCSMQKNENLSVSKKEYNPKKTLLGPKIYHCEHCGKGFWSLGAFSHHKQNKTECTDLRLRKGLVGSVGHSRSKIACPVCGRTFRHKGIMALHMRKHENGNHKCELCNRSFRLFSSLLRHQVVHNDQLLPPPAKSFQHQVEQVKKNTYSCPDCGKLFSRAKALQFHMKSHGYETGYSPSSPKSTVTLEALQCALCLAHFNSRTSLKAHRKLCMKRDKVLDSKADQMGVGAREVFQEKGANVEGNELAIVELDTQTCVSNPDNLRSNDLEYKCKKCDKSFAVIGELNSHNRIHAEGHKLLEIPESMPLICKKVKQEEPSKGLFHCSECGRRFMSNSALGSHKRWHKEKKFSRSLRDDLKSVIPKVDGGPFPCQKCGKQFFNLYVLQRHQMFNLQCQTQMEPESDSKPSVKNILVSKNSEFSFPCSKTFVQDSFPDTEHENKRHSTLERTHHEIDTSILFDQAPKQVNANGQGREVMPLTLKSHQCPLCTMTFAKVEGLRAHKWQAHTKKGKGKNSSSSTKVVSIASSGDVKKSGDSPAVNSDKITVKDGFVRRGKETRGGTSPVQSVTSPDCGVRCNPGFFLKKIFKQEKLESEQEIHISETRAEFPSPLNHLSDHSAKFLFKCSKCGKAFQTEEQLDNHKTKGKSRPYSCTLCCQGLWTESQLQQHLVWHDEVRCRLPNEVRYRLSTAMTSKTLTPNNLCEDRRSTLGPDRQLPSVVQCQATGNAFFSPTMAQRNKARPCNDDSYHCSLCPRTFSEIQELIDHHQECSDQQNSFTCKDCGLTFKDQDVFDAHLHQHALEEDEQMVDTVQMEDNGNGTAQLDSERGNSGEDSDVDILGDVDGYDASVLSEIKSSGSVEDERNKSYACSVCGEIYTSLVSFNKHRRAHKKAPSQKEKINECRCPECGMSFIKKRRLLAHLNDPKSHTFATDSLTRCDTCGKDCATASSLASHVALHKERPFWCLSCAQGFINEGELDKHLQTHDNKLHKCNICHKSFSVSTHLIDHYNTHADAPYRCTLCGKSFQLAGCLILHKEKHTGAHAANGMSLGIKTSEINTKKPEMGTNVEELSGKEEDTEESELLKPCETVGCEDHSNSDCGEPAHQFESCNSSGLVGVDTPNQKSKTGEAQGEELDQSESRVACVYKEQKHWEWECWECDTGFDEVEKLHLHYVKHATGELPILQEDGDS